MLGLIVVSVAGDPRRASETQHSNPSGTKDEFSLGTDTRDVGGAVSVARGYCKGSCQTWLRYSHGDPDPPPPGTAGALAGTSSRVPGFMTLLFPTPFFLRASYFACLLVFGYVYVSEKEYERCCGSGTLSPGEFRFLDFLVLVVSSLGPSRKSSKRSNDVARASGSSHSADCGVCGAGFLSY